MSGMIIKKKYYIGFNIYLNIILNLLHDMLSLDKR